MSTHSFKITVGLSAGSSKIEMDGRELVGVSRVSFTLAADGITTLHLEITGSVEVEGEFRDSAVLQVDQKALPWFLDKTDA